MTNHEWMEQKREWKATWRRDALAAVASGYRYQGDGTRATARNVELVVVGARRRGKHPFGSTVEAVLKRSPCRVLIVAPPPDAVAARSAA